MFFPVLEHCTYLAADPKTHTRLICGVLEKSSSAQVHTRLAMISSHMELTLRKMSSLFRSITPHRLQSPPPGQIVENVFKISSNLDKYLMGLIVKKNYSRFIRWTSAIVLYFIVFFPKFNSTLAIFAFHILIYVMLVIM